MRKIVVAGNWKMNKTVDKADLFFRELSHYLLGNDINRTEVIICPPALYLQISTEYSIKNKFYTGAQNIFLQDFGAYTGEISAPMLKSIGVDFCIAGHSERRKYFYETDDDVNIKIKKLLDFNIKPIVCVGETLEQREDNKTEEIILSQLDGAFHDIDFISSILIAYEPVWAIGTGKTATPEQAQEIHILIRNWLSKKYSPELAEEVIILYGGSINPNNATELFGQSDIDGGLIGGASLEISDFTKLIEIAQKI